MGEASTPRSTNEIGARQEEEVIKSKVSMTDKGLIDATRSGKDRWYADLKVEVLRFMDISIIAFNNQHPSDWAVVINSLNAKWEYVGNDGNGVDDVCVERFAMKTLKIKRHRLRAA